MIRYQVKADGHFIMGNEKCNSVGTGCDDSQFPVGYCGLPISGNQNDNLPFLVSGIEGQTCYLIIVPPFLTDAFLTLPPAFIPAEDRNNLNEITGCICDPDGKRDAQADADVLEQSELTLHEPLTGLAPRFSLAPNPFHQDTRLKIDLPSDDRLTIVLWDISGRKAKTLFQGKLTAGSQEIQIDREGLSNGIYSLHIQHQTGQKIMKIIIQ